MEGIDINDIEDNLDPAIFLRDGDSDFISSKFFKLLISGADAVDYFERLNIPKHHFSKKILNSLETKRTAREKDFEKLNVNENVLFNFNSCLKNTLEENSDDASYPSEKSFSETFFKELRLSSERLQEVIDCNNGVTGPFEYLVDDDDKDYSQPSKNTVLEFEAEVNAILEMGQEEEESDDEEIQVTSKMNRNAPLVVTRCSPSEEVLQVDSDSGSSYEKSMENLKTSVLSEVKDSQPEKPGGYWKKEVAGRKKSSKQQNKWKKKSSASKEVKGSEKNSHQSEPDGSKDKIAQSKSTKKPVSTTENKRPNEPETPGKSPQKTTDQSNKALQRDEKPEHPSSSTKAGISSKAEEKPTSPPQVPVEPSSQKTDQAEKRQVKAAAKESSSDDFFEKSLGTKSFRARLTQKK